jgi:hypothetical protein
MTPMRFMAASFHTVPRFGMCFCIDPAPFGSWPEDSGARSYAIGRRDEKPRMFLHR